MSGRFSRVLLLAAILVVAAPGADASSRLAPPDPSSTGSPPASTPISLVPEGFAILAVDTLDGEWGVAAVSRWIAVGARSVQARARAGAWVNLGAPDPTLGARALDRLGRGASAKALLDSLVAADPASASRQLAVVDASGRVASFTGANVLRWAGSREGKGYVCQGLALRGDEALVAMARAFETARGTLAERLLASLDAADAIALLRGQPESAALLVVREGGGAGGAGDRMTDLRVDEAEDAIPALHRLYAIHAATFLPSAYARFGDEAKRHGDSVTASREYDRAEMGFRAAVARSPKDPDALNELAWFLALHGNDPDEAVRFAQSAVDARPGDPNLLDTLAETEYRAGSLHRAIDAMERAVKRSSGEARYVERLRRWERERDALEKSGRPQEGTPR